MAPFTIGRPPDSQTTQLPASWHAEIAKWMGQGKHSCEIVRDIKTTLHGKSNHAQVGRFMTQRKLALAAREQIPRYEQLQFRLDERQVRLDDLQDQMCSLSVLMDEPETTWEQLDGLKARHIALAREMRAVARELERLDRAIARHERLLAMLPEAERPVPVPRPPPEPVIIDITPIPPPPGQLDMNLLTCEELCVLGYLAGRQTPGSGVEALPMPPEVVDAGAAFDGVQSPIRRGLTAVLIKNPPSPPDSPPTRPAEGPRPLEPGRKPGPGNKKA